MYLARRSDLIDNFIILSKDDMFKDSTLISSFAKAWSKDSSWFFLALSWSKNQDFKELFKFGSLE